MEQAFEKREQLLRQLEVEDVTYEDGILITQEPEVDKRGVVIFRHNQLFSPDEIEGIETAPIYFERGIDRWDADIRDKSFKLKERKRRELDRRLWMALYLACGLALFLIFGQITRLGLASYNSHLGKKISAQKSIVQKIEEDANLLDRLNQLSEREFRPYVMLGILNIERPDSIYFESTKAHMPDELEVRGISTSVDQVNTFLEKLLTYPAIEQAELTNIQTRKGQVNFTLKSQFNLEGAGN